MTPSRLSLVTLVLALLMARVVAQSPAPEPTQSFEVASVRPNTSGATAMSARILPGGRYDLRKLSY